MKKLLFAIFSVSVVLSSCGPAAEDRFQMDRVSKRMSDSLQHLIDSSLNDPARHVNLNVPSPAPPQPVAQPTAAPNPSQAVNHK
jgi:hypothetical protein